MTIAGELRVTSDIVTAENLESCEKLLLSLKVNQAKLNAMTLRSPVICSVADIRCVLQSARDVRDLIEALEVGIRERRRRSKAQSSPVSSSQPNVM